MFRIVIGEGIFGEYDNFYENGKGYFFWFSRGINKNWICLREILGVLEVRIFFWEYFVMFYILYDWFFFLKFKF